MNAKKAKALRKVLRNMVKNHPEKVPVHSFTLVPKTEKAIFVDQTDENGEVIGVEKHVIHEGQLRVAPRSQRAVYLHLKKELNKDS